MIIDTESPEGKALVALAKFGAYTLESTALWGDADAFASSLGLVSHTPTGWCTPTALAKLPEGI
jgi:hypothetical protein